MTFLTQPIGAPNPEPEFKHSDEWLDECTASVAPGEAYARWWLEQARYPAWKKMLYNGVMKQFQLFCDYNGSRWRVTGASRMGDIWVARDYTREAGYDLRVNVLDCTNWGRSA